MEFYTLTLPRSDLSIQWREDDMMRIAPASTIENKHWSPVSVMYTTARTRSNRRSGPEIALTRHGGW